MTRAGALGVRSTVFILGRRYLGAPPGYVGAAGGTIDPCTWQHFPAIHFGRAPRSERDRVEPFLTQIGPRQAIEVAR